MKTPVKEIRVTIFPQSDIDLYAIEEPFVSGEYDPGTKKITLWIKIPRGSDRYLDFKPKYRSKVDGHVTGTVAHELIHAVQHRDKQIEDFGTNARALNYLLSPGEKPAWVRSIIDHGRSNGTTDFRETAKEVLWGLRLTKEELEIAIDSLYELYKKTTAVSGLLKSEVHVPKTNINRATFVCGGLFEVWCLIVRWRLRHLEAGLLPNFLFGFFTIQFVNLPWCEHRTPMCIYIQHTTP